MKYLTITTNQLATDGWGVGTPRRITTYDTVKEFSSLEDVEKYCLENLGKFIRVFEVSKEIKFAHKFNWE